MSYLNQEKLLERSKGHNKCCKNKISSIVIEVIWTVLVFFFMKDILNVKTQTKASK